MTRSAVLLLLTAPAAAADPTPKPLLELPADPVGTARVRFSPTGTQLTARGELTESTHVWDLPAGTRAKTVRWPDAISPDGKLAAWVEAEKGILVTDAGLKELYRIADVSKEHPRPRAEAAYFSPDGKTLYYTYNTFIGYGREQWLRAVDAATGANKRDLIAPQWEGIAPPRFAPDGKTLVTTLGKDVVVFDLATGKEAARLSGHPRGAGRVAYSPDGKVIASVGVDKLPPFGLDSTVRLWDAATGKELHALAGHTEVVRGLEFSPDGRHLLSGGMDETLRVWDVAAGKEVVRYKPLVRTAQPDNVPNGRGIHAMAVSPDGKLLAVGGNDRAVKVWEFSALVPKGK
ncbi:MAG: hypothetical protein C0501_00905 [Isosphaera sp.]|nr:hypothetical protein [Isosphaera sp.]